MIGALVSDTIRLMREQRRPPKDIGVLLKGQLVVKFLADEKLVTRRTDLAKWRNAKPGDRIWFRETWQAVHFCRDVETGVVDDIWHAEKIPTSNDDGEWTVVYAADEECAWGPTAEDRGFPWRPSLLMPKWAARCWAVVEDIHEEPLQAITYDDIRLEGIRCPEHDFASGFCVGSCLALGNEWVRTWDSINGKKPGLSWKDNPTVARIKFRRIEAPK